MRPLQQMLVIGFLLASIPGLVASQTALPARTVIAQPAVDLRLAAPLAGTDARLRSRVAASRRPWWALPVGGAVVGGALGAFVTYRECQNDDCIGAGGLTIAGAGVGAIVGLILEGGLHALR